MNPNRSTVIVVIILLGALVMLSLYVGSYIALADNSGTLRMGNDGLCYVRQYRYGGDAAAWFYWPLHYVDRQLRPAYWNGTG